MKKSLATLAILFVGCATGAAVQGIAAQSFAPNPSAPRWQQECEVHGMKLKAFNPLVASRGDDGWELVGQVGNYVCFKRPAP